MKWNTPHDWLAWKMKKISRKELMEMSQKIWIPMNSLSIQLEFQTEMIKDGYFYTK